MHDSYSLCQPFIQEIASYRFCNYSLYNFFFLQRQYLSESNSVKKLYSKLINEISNIFFNIQYVLHPKLI